jgi:hypothetical protein
MMPFFHFQKSKTPEELQRERIAQDAKQLKEDLSRMAPEERARFWADIEGTGGDGGKPTPSTTENQESKLTSVNRSRHK